MAVGRKVTSDKGKGQFEAAWREQAMQELREEQVGQQSGGPVIKF